jgi:hypothetical protein
MSFLTKKEDKPEFESIGIRFEKPVLEMLDRYQEFSNRDNRSEVTNDILRKVFETDEEFAAYKSNGSAGKRGAKGKPNGPPPVSGDGTGTSSAEVKGIVRS